PCPRPGGAPNARLRRTRSSRAACSAAGRACPGGTRRPREPPPPGRASSSLDLVDADAAAQLLEELPGQDAVEAGVPGLDADEELVPAGEGELRHVEDRVVGLG